MQKVLIALFNLFHIPDFLSTAALRNALFMCHIFYEREREGSECNSIMCSIVSIQKYGGYRGR